MEKVVIKPLLTVTIGMLALLATPSSYAVVTVQGYWTMGSDDPGAVAGGAVSSTEDISGNNRDLIKAGGGGSMVYSSDVPSPSLDPATPNLSINSSGASTGVYLGQSSSTTYNYGDNFGVQFWVKSSLASSGTQFLLFNGNTAGYGWGMMQQANTYKAVLGGVALVGSTPSLTTEWTHLALVIDQNTFGVSFYVNGVVNATLEGVSPFQTTGLPGETFNVGAYPGGAVTASTLYADVQVFTFASGQFNASTDLLYTVPEPSTVGLGVLALGSILFMTKVRRKAPKA